MKKVKLSISGCPANNQLNEEGFSSISKFLPEGKNYLAGYEFYINQEVAEPDFWFVIDELNDIEQATISKDKVFFLTAEVPFVTSYFSDEEFLSQFHKIYSPHAIYNHDNNLALPFLPYMINAAHGESIMRYDPEFNYDIMKQTDSYEKTKNISLFASNKGSHKNFMTQFHQIRYNFALRLKEHFKDKIDLYGYGHNEIVTKAEAIIPYKYHIVLENQATMNIITEKLYDSYLGLAYPIYWGAPNADKYFSKDSFSAINILDFKQTVRVIEQVLEEDFYEQKRKCLIEAKNKVLDEYGVFQRIAKICNETNVAQSSQRENIVLKPRRSFQNHESKKIKKLKKLFKYGVPSVITYELIRQLINL